MKPSIEQQLAAVPAGIRARILAAERLEPGAAAVVGRFFTSLAQRGEPAASPSRASFDAAARSEATLATLLRTLQAYVPEVRLAAGREARKAWYTRRPKSGAPRRRGRAPLPPQAPTSWPVEWALLYSRLLRAPIAEASRRRYVDSVNRLAAVLPPDVAPDGSRFMACSLFEALIDRGEQARDIAALREQVAATTAEKEGIAARLGEAERELAEAGTALGREIEARKQAEERNAKLRSMVDAARAALDLVSDAAATAGSDAADIVRTTDLSAAGERLEGEATEVVDPGQTTEDEGTERTTAPELVAAIERRDEEQLCEFAALRVMFTALAAEKEEIAARFVEAERGLAEARIAIEIEKEKRKEAEVFSTTLHAAIATAREVLALGA